MSDFKDKLNEIMDTEDTTVFFSEEDIRKNKAMACLAYWGPLVLIPIFATKDSPFAKYHANQGLLLLLFNIAFSIVSSVIEFLLGRIPIISHIVSIVLSLISIGIFIYVIVRTVSAYRGEAKEIPFIGKYRLIK